MFYFRRSVNHGLVRKIHKGTLFLLSPWYFLHPLTISVGFENISLFLLFRMRRPALDLLVECGILQIQQPELGISKELASSIRLNTYVEYVYIFQ